MSGKLIFAAGTAMFLVGCAPLRQSPSTAPAVTEEVSAFLTNYLDAISSRDTARIRAAYVADDRFVWLELGNIQYRRVDEVLAGLAMYPAETPIRTQLEDLTVVPVSQSAAHAWARFHTSVGDAPKGFSYAGAISFTLERQGAAWKIVGGHASGPRGQ